MERLQKVLLIALISTSGAAWVASWASQAVMMGSMMAPYNALSISLFVVVWTSGMAAMMFPSISPVILLYNKLIRNGQDNGTLIIEGKSQYSARTAVFVSCYLAVWAITGLALLLGSSLLLNSAVGAIGLSGVIYGTIVIAAGAYQFSPLKSKCLGYCESPMSFFMRRWRNGTAGAITMGTYHGIYCLGCCWPYFLLMVALGWMDIVWMALFAGIIFGEKMWLRGVWVSRGIGAALTIVGVITALGFVDVSTHQSVTDQVITPIQEFDPMQGQMDS